MKRPALSIQMGKIPSGDPVAFMSGFSHGYWGKPPTPCAAMAYKRAYREGKAVKAGVKPLPDYVALVGEDPPLQQQNKEAK